MTSHGFSQGFQELAELGRLTETVSFCGHEFTIKTLNTAEQLAVGKVVSSHRGTLGEEKAAAAGFAAAGTLSINGVPFFPNLTNSDVESNLSLKFRQILEWHPLIVEYLFVEQAKLERRSADALEELKKKREVTIPNSDDTQEDLRSKESSPEDP